MNKSFKLHHFDAILGKIASFWQNCIILMQFWAKLLMQLFDAVLGFGKSCIILMQFWGKIASF